MHPDISILFVGAKGRLEMEKVPAAGFPIEGLVISGFQRGAVLPNLAFPFKVMGSVLEAFSIVNRFQPDVAIGVGGYASGPTLFAASMIGIPCLLQEQNSHAGVTNKILSRWASKICVAYSGMEKFFNKEKLVFTGNPVRSEIQQIKVGKEEACQHFGLSPNKKTVLVMGGSLGARTINRALAGGLEKLVKANQQIIWQTGKFYEQFGLEKSSLFSENVKALPFITQIEKAYAAADIIVSRAGALSISELCLVGKPVILIPSPNVAEDHQTMNAKTLQKENAAILVTDAKAGEMLTGQIIKLCEDEAMRKTLSANIQKMAKPEATQKIANEVMNLISKQ